MWPHEMSNLYKRKPIIIRMKDSVVLDHKHQCRARRAFSAAVKSNQLISKPVSEENSKYA